MFHPILVRQDEFGLWEKLETRNKKTGGKPKTVSGNRLVNLGKLFEDCTCESAWQMYLGINYYRMKETKAGPLLILPSSGQYMLLTTPIKIPRFVFSW